MIVKYMDSKRKTRSDEELENEIDDFNDRLSVLKEFLREGLNRGWKIEKIAKCLILRL